MSRSLLLFLGAVALGGGVFYLYKSGKLVGTPGEMAYGAPKQVFQVNRKPIDLSLSGYTW
jgi:hypothetical protein